MNARRVVIGCLVTAAVALGLAIVVAVMAWRQFSAPVPILSARGLVDASTVGFAVLRLEPDDPWIQGLFQSIDRNSVGRRNNPSEVLPAELVWTARPSGEPGHEGQLLLAAFAPRGRFIGMMADFTLWKLGRAGGPKIAREIYNGEGLTSFPGGAIPGVLFVRGNQLVWASDSETAHTGVDRVVQPPPEPDAAVTPVLKLLGDPGKASFSGAILNSGGEIARILTRLPGTGLDLSEGEIGPALGLRFDFSTTAADTGEGRIVLTFADDIPAETIAAAGQALASRLPAMAPAGVTLEVDSAPAPGAAVLTVRVSGLQTLHSRFLTEGVRALKRLEDSGNAEGAKTEEPAAGKDQSSSTFQ